MNTTIQQNGNWIDYSEEELSILEEEYFLEEEKFITRIYVALIGIIATNSLFGFFLPSTLLRITELVFCGVTGHSLYRLYKMDAMIKFQGWSKLLCTLLVLCLLQILIRGNWLELSMREIPLYILSKTFCLPYLLPFCILFLPNREHIEKISNIFFWGSLLVFPIWLLNADNLIGKTFEGESIGAYLPFLACFLIAYPTELSTRRKITVWIIWAIYLVLMLLNARRNMIFSLAYYAFIGYYVNIGKHISSSMTLRIIFNGVASFMVIIPLVLNFSFLTSTYFQRLNERLGENTRTEVELLFWADYMSSTQPEQAFGKGAYGSYYQESKNLQTGEVSTDRFLIETGYLNMLLKGGYVFMVIIILIMLTCMIKAFQIKWLEGLYLRLAFILYPIDCYTTDLTCFFTFQSVIFWLSINLVLSNWPQYEEDDQGEYEFETECLKH